MTKKSQLNMFRVSVIALLVAILAVMCLFLSKEQSFTSSFGKKSSDDCVMPKNALTEDFRQAAAKNAGMGKLKCAADNWLKVVENDQTDVEALANLAIVLTQAERHQEALPYYEKAVKLGTGAYDMFAWYARNLKALGRPQESIEWYYRVLSIDPNFADITEELSTLLVASDASYEAIGLLSGFNTRSGRPNYFKGHISIETSLPSTSPQQDKFRTASLGGHFYIPIKLAAKGDIRGGMVDTGASFMTLDRALLVEDKVSYRTVKDTVSLKSADGRTVHGEQVTLPELQVGPYRLENVLAVVCDGCTMLVGQNVLEHFDTEKNTLKG